jgi:hypothetical protein
MSNIKDSGGRGAVAQAGAHEWPLTPGVPPGREVAGTATLAEAAGTPLPASPRWHAFAASTRDGSKR